MENGSPFLFKNGAYSTRRLQSFLRADGAEVSLTVKEPENKFTWNLLHDIVYYTLDSLPLNIINVAHFF